MTYVRIENGVPTEWPIFDFQIRSYLKLVSLPVDLTSTNLEGHGFEPFAQAAPPTCDEVLQYVEEITPEKDKSGIWVQTYSIVDRYQTTEDQEKARAQHNEQLRLLAEINVRTERNRYLAASDWTQVADAPVDQAAWANYRQSLRDITNQAGFPFDVQWPTFPN